MIFNSRKIWTSAFGLASALALGVGVGSYFGQSSCEPAAQERISEISRLQERLADAAARVKSLRKENAALKRSLQEIEQTAANKVLEDKAALSVRSDIVALPKAVTPPVSSRPRSVVTKAIQETANNTLTTTKSATVKADTSVHALPSLSIANRIVRPEQGPTVTQAYSPLPHIDAHISSGNRRTITGTDIWVPLSWDGTNLTFLDARLVRDTLDDLEGNFGIGFRKVVGGKGIWGAYGYYDARQTTYNNTFSQATLGTEWLAEDWDARANAYVSLSGKKSFTATLPTTISFSGTGLVAHGGTSTLTEVPLSGFDTEIGYRIPFPSSLPETRIYGGGYYFTGDDIESVRGVRGRIRSDITEWLQLGAEYRHDNVRDSETLAELRLRYRFGDTSIKPSSKLLERIDEQPVRDVDIVTNGTSTQQTSSSVVTNATSGLAQKIYVVDNTAAGGGDGSKEHPFNTIAAATAVASTNDIIYVKAGDGTSAGMNSGVILDDNGQKLIGSGTALTFGDLGITITGLAAPSNSYVISPATTAPIITNTLAFSDGISISANNIYVAGVTVDGTTRDGIRVTAGAGQNRQDIRIKDVTLSNNQNIGLALITTGGGQITDPSLSGITAEHNLFDGIQFNSSGAGSLITGISLTDSLLEANARYGIYGLAQTTGDIGTISVDGTSARNNGEIGMVFQTNVAGSYISSISLIDNISEDNADTGIYINAASGGLINSATLSDMTVRDNGENGIYLISSGAGSNIASATLVDSLIENNANNGYYVYATGGSDIGTLSTNGTTITKSGATGYYVLTDNATSVISSHTLTDSVVNDNDDYGIYVYASNGQVTTSTMTNVTAEDNRADGIRLAANAATGQIGTLSMSGVSSIDNSDTGLYLLASGGTFGSVTLSDIESLDNGTHGLYTGTTGATGLISAYSLTDSLLQNNRVHGIMLDTTTAAQFVTANLSGLVIQDNEENGLYMTSNGVGSLIGTVTVDDVTINRSAGHGFYAYATGGGDFTSLLLSDIQSADNGSHGYYLTTDNSGSIISNISLTDSTASDSATDGFYVYANSGQITTLTLDNLSASGSGDQGFEIRSAGATGLINTLSLTNSSSTHNADQGIYLYTTGGADITSASLSGLTITNNGANGLYAVTDNATSIIGNLSLSNISSIDNGNTGFSVYANAGQITTATLSDLISRDNGDNGYSLQTNAVTGLIDTLSVTNASSLDDAGQGFYLYATGGADIATATISDLSVTNSGAAGIYVQANAAGSTISNLSLTGSSSNSNATHGVYVTGTAGGVLTSATLDDITANDNRANGISIVTTGASQINSLSLTNSTISGNFDYGLLLNAQNTSIFSAKVQGVSATNNYQYGVFVDDDTTGAYSVDLGGGALGSTGGNRIFGSLIQDIRIDLDNNQLKAESNWWGNAAGLQASERQLDGTSTIDSSPFLAADPNP